MIVETTASDVCPDCGTDLEHHTAEQDALFIHGGLRRDRTHRHLALPGLRLVAATREVRSLPTTNREPVSTRVRVTRASCVCGYQRHHTTTSHNPRTR